jgi:chromosome partitioning protein
VKIIAVCNPKGGCGKTTIITNLATFLCSWGYNVVILDADSQSSSIDWNHARQHQELTLIQVIATDQEKLIDRLQQAHSAHQARTIMLVDLPAAFPVELELSLHSLVDVMLYPFIASPIDVRAMVRHLFRLHKSNHRSDSRLKTAVIMNRALTNTMIYHSVLASFISKISFPLIGELRETQNYPKAAAEGKGLVELPIRQVIKDLLQWKPILEWLATELFPQQAISAFPTIDESWMKSVQSPPDPAQ